MVAAGETAVGIDLGGTNVRVGVVEPNGQVRAFGSAPFDARRGVVPGLDQVADLVRTCLREAGDPPLAAIGIGATGPLDTMAGRIRNPYTLETWADVEVRGPLEEAFDVSVTLENDAVVAALASGGRERAGGRRTAWRW